MELHYEGGKVWGFTQALDYWGERARWEVVVREN